MNLDQILMFIQAGAGWAALIPGAGTVTAWSSALIRIILAAKSAHEKVTGEPLDLSKLTDLPHVD